LSAALEERERKSWKKATEKELGKKAKRDEQRDTALPGRGGHLLALVAP
jgi:hypothetical protein